MTAVILTIHTLIVLGLIVVVLLQRSDGGALGLGGGGGAGGFMTGRGAANALTRTTSILAALFFATSLGLAIYAGSGEDAETVIEGLTGEAAPEPADDGLAAPSTDDLLQSLGGETVDEPTPAESTNEVPLTEAEILDSLGTDTTVPVESSETEEASTETDEPDQ